MYRLCITGSLVKHILDGTQESPEIDHCRCLSIASQATDYLAPLAERGFTHSRKDAQAVEIKYLRRSGAAWSSCMGEHCLAILLSKTQKKARPYCRKWCRFLLWFGAHAPPTRSLCDIIQSTGAAAWTPWTRMQPSPSSASNRLSMSFDGALRATVLGRHPSFRAKKPLASGACLRLQPLFRQSFSDIEFVEGRCVTRSVACMARVEIAPAGRAKAPGMPPKWSVVDRSQFEPGFNAYTFGGLDREKETKHWETVETVEK